jgi:hypothetical protein
MKVEAKVAAKISIIPESANNFFFILIYLTITLNHFIP